MTPFQAFFFGALIGTAIMTIAAMLVVTRAERRKPPYTPGRWWRVIDTFDDSVWCETSDETEARDEMRSASDRLERLYERTESEWRSAQ